MENTTSFPENTDITRFVVLETSFSFLTLIVLYIVFCLLWYERTLLRNGSPGNGSSTPTNTAKYALAMRVQSILGPVFFLGRLATDHYELLAQYLQREPHDFCNVTWIVKIVCTALCISMVYLFLWTRQSFCYSDQSMRHLTTCATTALSWATLALIFVAEIICTILFGVTRFYRLTAKGCVLDTFTIPDNIPWIVLAVSTVGFQALLCGLFLYPLLKHRSVGTSSIRAFLPLVKRTTITATICISSDITATIIILFVEDQYNIVPDLVYALNLMINVVSVIAAFRDWRAKLFPMCVADRRRNDDLSIAGETNHSGSCSANRSKFTTTGDHATKIQTISTGIIYPKQLSDQAHVNNVASFQDESL
ncbi:uncharacterized protein LOC144745815 [Ciona intestinalis]